MDKNKAIEIITGLIITGYNAESKTQILMEKIEALKLAKECIKESMITENSLA